MHLQQVATLISVIVYTQKPYKYTVPTNLKISSLNVYSNIDLPTSQLIDKYNLQYKIGIVPIAIPKIK